jgi:hypothetical protein
MDRMTPSKIGGFWLLTISFYLLSTETVCLAYAVDVLLWVSCPCIMGTYPYSAIEQHGPYCQVCTMYGRCCVSLRQCYTGCMV